MRSLTDITDTRLWDTVDWAIRLLAGELGQPVPALFGLERVIYVGDRKLCFHVRADTGRRGPQPDKNTYPEVIYKPDTFEGEPCGIELFPWTLKVYGVHRRIARAALLMALVELDVIDHVQAERNAARWGSWIFCRYYHLLPRVEDARRVPTCTRVTLQWDEAGMLVSQPIAT